MSEICDRWAAIINPVSGGGRGMRDWPEIERLLRDNGIIPECFFTERRYHAVELAVEAVSQGFRRVVTVGGDGTLHEVVNGIFLQQEVAADDITVAAISVGTGNDWARTYGFPGDYASAVAAIADGNTTRQDIALVSYFGSGYPQTRYMVNTAGMAFDSLVIAQYDRLKEDGRSGKSIYIWSLLRALFAFRAENAKIWIDGRLVMDGPAFSISVGIGRYKGGGMMQLPLAEPSDGLLDVTAIRKIRRLKVVRKLKTLFNGTIYGVDEASHHRGYRIRAECGPDVLLETDGEILGHGPFGFEAIEKALRIIVPPDYVGTA